MKYQFYTLLFLSLFLVFNSGCSSDTDSKNDNKSTISFTINGNVTNDYIGHKITFTRNTFSYLPDDEQNAISLRTGEYEDIIGNDSLEYRLANDSENSIYIRITSDDIGTYDTNDNQSSPMYITLTTRDGKTYKSSNSEWPKKLLSVTISDSSKNRLTGTFTATLNAYYEENYGLYYDKDLSEEGQLYVNGEFDIVRQ
ncbi:MAG: hypothetical protein HQK76_13695 [Desulfobacterales bacterium]|nr:hypothetical protein [Desulfobacterales bacterium]